MTIADIRIALPLLILATGALLTLLVGALSRNERLVAWLAVGTSVGAGLWALQTPPQLLAPTLGLAAGCLSRLFTVVFTLMAAAVLVLSRGYNRHRNIHGEEFSATVLFTAFGMVALASATNLLIVFLGLEAMTFGFYILVAFDRGQKGSGEAGLKYLMMGAVSTAFAAFGIALLYCFSGTLGIRKAMEATLVAFPAQPVTLAGWACLLIGIAFKLSLVPGHLWTPDVYQAAPAPVVAFLSGSSKATAILLLLMLLPHGSDLASLHLPLFAMALLSMLVGNLAALRQTRLRRMLAYSSIAQMGYVAVALVSYRGDGFQAAAFYAIAYCLMSLAAFGAIAVLEGHGCGAKLDDYRGRGFTQPLAAGVLTIALFSLAGVPPSIGFTGKFLIFAAAIRAGEITLAVLGILTAAASIYYYLRVVSILYLRRSAQTAKEGSGGLFEMVTLGLIAALVVGLGLFPAQLLDFLKNQLP